MSQQQYAWMLALIAAWRQQRAADNPEGASQLRDVYAQAGTFTNHKEDSANDLAALQVALLFILAWNLSKYLAIRTVFAQKRPKKLQDIWCAFRAADNATSLAITALPEKKAFFWWPLPLCQMNSPLTQRQPLEEA